MNETPLLKRHLFWILVSAIIVFILGFWGYSNYVLTHSIPHTLADIVYVTFQLFVLESGNLAGDISLPFEFARFLAPLVAAWAIILAFAEIFKKQWQKFRLVCRRKHAVIIGFGAQGRHLASEFEKNKRKIVVIDQNPGNSDAEYVRKQKGILINGDAGDEIVLEQARVHKAKYVVSFIEDDNAHIEIAFKIWQLCKKRKSSKYKIITALHVKDPDYVNLLSHHEKTVNTTENYDLRIFNSYENSVRSLMQDHPFDRRGIQKDSSQFVQIILIGFGDMGKRIVLHTAQTCHFANQKKPAIIMYDANIELEQNRFLTKNPAIKDICDIQWKPFDFDNINLEKEISSKLTNENAVTTILFVFDDPVKNILKASEICPLVKDDTKVLVWMPDESVMADALETGKGDFFANQIKVFGLPKQTSSFELIIEEKLDKLARAIHEHYLDKFPPKGEPRPSQLPWNQLSQEYKDANRQAANHIPVKLRAVNCKVDSEKDKRPQAEFSSDEIEIMAIMEHNRWCAERRLKGWTYAPIRDDFKKQNDCLVSWDKLPDKEKKKDREQVRNLHDILSRIVLKIIRRTD